MRIRGVGPDDPVPAGQEAPSRARMMISVTEAVARIGLRTRIGSVVWTPGLADHRSRSIRASTSGTEAQMSSIIPTAHQDRLAACSQNRATFGERGVWQLGCVHSDLLNHLG